MRTLKEVDALRDRLKAEGVPLPEAVRIIAEACCGWPYVFGAWGEECTPSNRRRRVRADHPTIKSACPALNGGSCSSCKWGIGVRMFDCRGFTRWCLQQVGLDITGQGATSQYNTAANWLERGEIEDMPECVCCVFIADGSKKSHTGLYEGDGKTVECSAGVQERALDKRWTHYAIPKGLYTAEEIAQIRRDKPKPKKTLRRGDLGDAVKELQERLNELGYDCGMADGIYGTKTVAAVKAFQQDNGLTPDGVCGQLTWAALERTEPEQLYRVSIDGVTWAQYRRILEICPLAEAERE